MITRIESQQIHNSPKIHEIRFSITPAEVRKVPISMHKSISSIALVRRMDQGRTRWLVRHHSCGDYYQLISATCLENESFRETIDRELSWACRLTRGKDYLLSSVPRLHMEVMLKSEGENVQAIFVEFYVADIYRDAVLAKLDEAEGFRWLSTDELRSGVTTDGQILDPLQSKLLAKADFLPHS